MLEFEDKLNHILVDTFNNITKYEEKSLRKISQVPITVSEVHLLQAIAQNGGSATVSCLSRILKVTRPTVTVAVKKLEKKELLKKETAEHDGRRFIITLTDSGQKIQRAHNIFHKRMIRNISKDFNTEEKEILLQSLTKLADFFKDKVKN